MVRRFLFACLLFVALPAHAGSCVVDFQTAVTETEEGKAAQKRIDAMLESKRDLASKIISAGEGWITELADSELRELFELSEDAAVAASGSDVEETTPRRRGRRRRSKKPFRRRGRRRGGKR